MKDSKFICVDEVCLGRLKLSCELDQSGRPVIRDREKNCVYDCTEEFAKLLPEVRSSDEFISLAKLCNFFAKGTEYKVIDEVKAFKECYLKRIEEEQEDVSTNSFHLTDSGVFDIEEVDSPFVAEEKLVFYVKSARDVPLRVSCRYPFEGHDFTISYQNLDYAY